MRNPCPSSIWSCVLSLDLELKFLLAGRHRQWVELVGLFGCWGSEPNGEDFAETFPCFVFELIPSHQLSRYWRRSPILPTFTYHNRSRPRIYIDTSVVVLCRRASVTVLSERKHCNREISVVVSRRRCIRVPPVGSAYTQDQRPSVPRSTLPVKEQVTTVSAAILVQLFHGC